MKKHNQLNIILCLLAAVCLLSGCHVPNKGVQTELGFRDDTTGIEYVACDLVAVKPLALDMENAYCVAGGVSYYTVNFQEPSEFLSDYDPESDSCLVYRNKQLPEVTVESFDAIAAFLYLDGITPVRIAQLYADDEFLPDELKGQNPSQDTALVRQITDALVNGTERTVADADVDQDTLYYFRLLSNKYPGLYYSVCFFGDCYGKYYVEDFRTHKTVDSPAEITAWIIGQEE